MKKLLITASTYSHIYRFHLPYLQAFQELGWEVHVASVGIPADAKYINKAIELPFEKRFVSVVNLQALRLLKALIREEEYDLIITHTALAAYYTRMSVKDSEHPPLVNVVHGYLFDENTPFVKRALLLNAERMTARETDLLLVMNEWEQRLTEREKLAKRSVKISGMGVDFSRLDSAMALDGVEARRRLGINKDAFVLIYAAEFSKRKSQNVLLDAITRLPENVNLLLLGEGKLLNRYRKKVQRLGLSGRVIMPGYVEDIAPWYRVADAAVTASRSEGLPFNVIEAMYMGLPVIGSAVKGNADLIRDGETGLLYPYGDAAACAACVRRLLTEPALCREMGSHAKQDAQRYSIEAVFPTVMKEYLSVLPPEKRKNTQIEQYRRLCRYTVDLSMRRLKVLAHHTKNDQPAAGEKMKDAQQFPEVSVIMCVYNGVQTVTQAAMSILNQSLPELELIICDDASMDGTWAQLETLAAADGRVRLLRNSRNLGAGASRNRCINCAKGRYIALMDADDSCASERLERQKAFLDSHPFIAFVGTRGIYEHSEPEQSYWYLRAPEKRDFLMTLPFVHASLLFRREVFDTLGGYDESSWLRRAEDYDLLMRAYEAEFRGENLPEALYIIRADSRFQQKTWRERFGECAIKFRDFPRLGLMPLGIPYAIKPLLVGLLPLPLLKRIKTRYYARWEKQ